MKVEDGVMMPRRATKKSAAYDFFAPEDIEIVPGEYTKIDTGVSFTGKEIVSFGNKRIFPADNAMWALILAPRSGFGTKKGFSIRNTIGLIDEDYVEHRIIAVVTAEEPMSIKKGEHFMQGFLVQVGVFADEIVPTEERDGGFGSTDKGGKDGN